MTIEEAVAAMHYYTDGFPWYWLSYGEKCYAFACVSAAPLHEDDPWPEPGSELKPNPVNYNTWLGENGTEMMAMEWISRIEEQNGDVICHFLALAHTHLCKPETSDE